MEETRYFKKIFELALRLQNSSSGMTKREIADFLGCSLKTVERKAEELEFCFGDAFIKSKTYPKTYKIRANAISKTLALSANDISAICQAADLLAKNNRTDEAQNLRLVAEKLQASLKPEDTFALEALMLAEGNASRPVPHKQVNMDIVSAIRDAIKTWSVVKIEYKSKKSSTYRTYTLCPFGILYGERKHYLLAKRYGDSGTEGLHYYIISNIRKISISKDKHFSVPEDFSIKNYTKDLFGMYNEEPFDVEWLFSAKAAQEAGQFIFHPSQTKEKQKDGSLLVRFRAGGCLEMAWHLYTWCGQVKVLKPADFWKRVAKARKEWF